MINFAPALKMGCLFFMGLTEDIKQSKFRNNRQKAALNILYTSNWLNEKTKEFLGEYDLTNQQFNVLRILRGSNTEPLSTQQIRERMLDKMSDTSRIVDRMLKKGLVKKKVCEGDKRLVDINITESGLDLLAKIDRRENELFTGMNQLTEEEAKLLSDLCDKVRT